MMKVKEYNKTAFLQKIKRENKLEPMNKDVKPRNKEKEEGRLKTESPN